MQEAALPREDEAPYIYQLVPTHMSVRITCINKDNGNHDNPHEAITALGWVNEQSGQTGISSRLEMYEWIKNKGGEAYIRDRNGNTAKVGTDVAPSGTKFVRTYADKIWTDNLLSLPEC